MKCFLIIVPESIGRFPVSVVRHGRLDMFVKVRYLSKLLLCAKGSSLLTKSLYSLRAESTSGSAIAGKDFIGTLHIRIT